jgi:hypothetical protein
MTAEHPQRHPIRLLCPSRSRLRPTRPLPDQTARGRPSSPFLAARARSRMVGRRVRPRNPSGYGPGGSRPERGIYEPASRALSTTTTAGPYTAAWREGQADLIEIKQQHSEIVAARHGELAEDREGRETVPASSPLSVTIVRASPAYRVAGDLLTAVERFVPRPPLSRRGVARCRRRGEPVAASASSIQVGA